MTANKDADVIARLEKAKQEAPELADLIELHRALLSAAAQSTAQNPPLISEPSLSAAEASAALANRTPLIRVTGLALDWDAFVARYSQVCEIAAQHRPDLATQFQDLRTRLETDPAAMRERVTDYIQRGVPETLEREAELLSFVANHALRPALRTFTDAMPTEASGATWHGGDCPICGGLPDFAFLDSDSGARHLVCSRCDTQWLFPRVKCPFCATAEPADLKFYPTEGEQYRLYVCNVCRRYLKTIDLRKARRSPLMPEVERVLSVDLDEAARAEGYR